MKTKVLKKRFFISIFVFSLLAMPLLTLAALDTPEKVQGVIEGIVKWMMNVFWVVAVGFIVWAAFNFLTAQGDAEKIQKAKKMLLYAVIAAAIVLLSNGIKVILTNIIAGQDFGSNPPAAQGERCGEGYCPTNMYCDQLTKTCIEM